MEIDRENYKKLVEACICFYRAEEDIYDLSADGKYGFDFYKMMNFLNVTRALSVYANQREDGLDDDVQLDKFNALVQAENYTLEEKVSILMGLAEDPFKGFEIYIDPTKNEGRQYSAAFEEILRKKP